MNVSTSPEIFYLVLTTGLTAVIWVPYIVNRIVESGLWTALQNPNPDDQPAAKWAYRAMSAHRNAIENLVIFAPLALAVHILGMSTEATALASMIFFFARLGHLLVYTFGVPLLRTMFFFAGFVCQAVLFIGLIG